MTAYEGYIEELEKDSTPSEFAAEAGADALGFVLALHNMFKENGYDLPEEPDTELLMNIIDGVHAELAAACIFLSEKSFEQVPMVLRKISVALEAADTDFVDPSGEKGPSVPTVVKKGFARLGDRIDATKVNKLQLADLLHKGVDK